MRVSEIIAMNLKLCLPLLVVGAASTSSAAWFQWSGNGHYYDVVRITGNDHSWSVANAQAQGLTGPTGSPVHLATLTSAAENEFVFSLVDDPTFWRIDGAGNNEGPYLGGFQALGSPEPAGSWQWVTGESWDYTAWSPGEPNNSGGNEDVLVFFGAGNSRTPRWNDGGNLSNSIIEYYVVESVPEPGTMVALAAALGGLVARRRNRSGS